MEDICKKRINSFTLSPHHAMNYVTHAGRNILQYTRGIKVFDNHELSFDYKIKEEIYKYKIQLT